MISSTEFIATVRVTMPMIAWQHRTPHFDMASIYSEEQTLVARCIIVSERRGVVSLGRLEFGDDWIDICFKNKFESSGSARVIHAPNARISDGNLDLRGAVWKEHPFFRSAAASEFKREVLASWVGFPRLVQEGSIADGALASSGLRLPQIGALHAIAAHWSVKTSHAKIVLPTGTGKSDVMIAAAIMKPAICALVIVPTDALRSQFFEKFARLGILRSAKAVDVTARSPKIARLTKLPRSIAQLQTLRSANAVVSTTQVLLGLGKDNLEEFLSWFDLIMFDEAHHLPAASWERISAGVAKDSRILSFTATPYRNDRRRLPGELIYQFPLKLAQAQGYFTKISVVRVDQADSDLADEEIARRAVDVLRSDERREPPKRHLIMARARTMEHADRLYEMYSRNFSDLSPVLLHSQIGVERRRRAVEGIKSLANRIIICVDMLGEGFDLPQLKIAALHDLHKSLPVTLQFIGRFARSSESVGDATVVMNVAEPMSETTIAELFADDADWNEVIPDLSAKAVRSEEDVARFVATMRAATNPEDKKFDLNLITTKTSATIYRAHRFSPENVEKGLRRSSRLHQSWINAERNLIVLITQDVVYPDWSTSKDAASFEWNLAAIYFDEEAQSIYINNTHGGSVARSLVQAVGGADVSLVNGEKMFRVFDGLHRSILYNVGLYRRGKLRFQMLAGMDIGESVTTAVQAGSAKSNLFAVGYSDGQKTSIGASAKGRIWSMSPSSIPDWVAWCRGLARKVANANIATNSFLQFTLIPTVVTVRPESEPFACVPPDELIPGDYYGERRLIVDGDQAAYSQVDLSFTIVSSDDDGISTDLLVAGIHEARMQMVWGEQFSVRQVAGSSISVADGSDMIPIADFLTEHPPAILLKDGSELIGRHHFKLPDSLPFTFSAESIQIKDWGVTPIRVESKWKNGVMRTDSIQGQMISECVAADNTFVFDDDDSGEAADIIVIQDQRDSFHLEATLYHCKYSSGDSPGARYADLYEVCGQAVKSARILHRADGLLAHMIKRESRLGGRPTRLEKGSFEDLKSLSRRVGLYRTRIKVCIVQPGLSASALTPELSMVLAAADGFIGDFTGHRIRVIGSA